MARLTILRIVPLSLVVLAATASPTAASVITTGDVDPGGAATQPDPWEVGAGLKVGFGRFLALLESFEFQPVFGSSDYAVFHRKL